jgi:hypothetical protein
MAKATGNHRAQAQVMASLAEAAPVGRANKQLVSAFGERAVEAELLRRGWVTANINASIRNVKDFDLFAAKNARSLQIRVKTCSANADVQYGTPQNQEITTDDIRETDFTVVVRMDATRNDDRFYVVPTPVVLQALAEWRRASLAEPGRKGPRKDEGHWVLRWREHREWQSRPNYGFEKKWAEYLNRWDQLDERTGYWSADNEKSSTQI